MRNRIIKLIKDLLIKEEWSIAIRKNDGTLLYDDGGFEKSFTVLRNSFRYWAADPFIISNDGKDYLFFEMFDRFKSKGIIGYREISNGKIGKMKIAYEADYHLSFPFVFKENNEIYMMPESSEGKTLDILKSNAFPDDWRISKNITKDRRFVDSSLFEKDGITYLFTQELKGGYSFSQLDLFEYNNKTLTPSRVNPIVNSSFNSRLAGRVFINDGKNVRVSQDCSEDYGKQLNFNFISDLSLESYSEELYKSVSFEDIVIDSKEKFFGVHTYNFNDNYEVIDLKNKSRVKLGNIINIFYRLISKFRRSV